MSGQRRAGGTVQRARRAGLPVQGVVPATIGRPGTRTLPEGHTVGAPPRVDRRGSTRLPGSDGTRLQVQCWCQRSIVWVPADDVLAGRTRRCHRWECATAEVRITTAEAMR